MHAWTKKELDDYDYAFMRDADERGRLEKAIEKAVARAVEKAEQMAEQKKEKSLIQRLNTKGKTATEIADLLGISIDSVRQAIEQQ